MCKIRILNYFLAIALLLFGQTNTPAQNGKSDEPEPARRGENVILRWNRVLNETVATPNAHPATIFPVRSYALLHAAMFDAANAIEGKYAPYLIEISPPRRGASAEAAAAQAAFEVLTALYPSRREIYALELTASITGIEEKKARRGIVVGQAAAQKLLAARARDGWTENPPPFLLPPVPGNWQPTPPNLPAAGYTLFPAAKPFAIASNKQFAPAPPPPLESERYAAALNEVREMGAANSTRRTADQTLVARLWNSSITPTTIFLAWNNVARSLVAARKNTTVETARLFALFHIAVHDSLLTTFTCKYEYGLWRPVTAIRRADEDGNPKTAADREWMSLMPTPPYPAYAGNQAAVGMAHATIFALFFGRDEIAFEHTWQGAPGWTRSYPSFSAMANEVAESRIYAGFHFRFDNEAGQLVGRSVANYVFRNYLTPRRRKR